ncbi:MAG TPA: hypothetical protein VLF19_10715 [Methylomirabilota bacterium]|nr:hypothetical protein [Methylomirabilota bacterium]
MSRRTVAAAVIWLLTLFFAAQMFAAPVSQLLQRLALTTEASPP